MKIWPSKNIFCPFVVIVFLLSLFLFRDFSDAGNSDDRLVVTTAIVIIVLFFIIFFGKTIELHHEELLLKRWYFQNYARIPVQDIIKIEGKKKHHIGPLFAGIAARVRYYFHVHTKDGQYVFEDGAYDYDDINRLFLELKNLNPKILFQEDVQNYLDSDRNRAMARKASRFWIVIALLILAFGLLLFFT